MEIACLLCAIRDEFYCFVIVCVFASVFVCVCAYMCVCVVCICACVCVRVIVCGVVCNRSFGRESNKKRHKCVAGRSKPVSEQQLVWCGGVSCVIDPSGGSLTKRGTNVWQEGQSQYLSSS